MTEGADKTWDERILEVMPSSVDGTLIAENLKLTPGERIAKMLATIETVQALRGAAYRK